MTTTMTTLQNSCHKNEYKIYIFKIQKLHSCKLQGVWLQSLYTWTWTAVRPHCIWGVWLQSLQTWTWTAVRPHCIWGGSDCSHCRPSSTSAVTLLTIELWVIFISFFCEEWREHCLANVGHLSSNLLNCWYQVSITFRKSIHNKQRL